MRLIPAKAAASDSVVSTSTVTSRLARWGGCAAGLALALPLLACSGPPGEALGETSSAILLKSRATVASSTLYALPDGTALPSSAVLYANFFHNSFVATTGPINVAVWVQNFPPGTYSVDIHQNYDCSAGGAKVGPIWDPTGEAHGVFGTHPFQLGALGNLTVDATGAGTLHISNTSLLSVDAPGTGVVGHSVVVHANPDDFTTQPDGNAGAPIACGGIWYVPSW